MNHSALSPPLVMWIALSWAKRRFASNSIGVVGSSRKTSIRSMILPIRVLISPPPANPRRAAQSRLSISTRAGKGRSGRLTSASVSGTPDDASSEAAAPSHEPGGSLSKGSVSSGRISDATNNERHFDDTLGLTAHGNRIAGAKQDGPRYRCCVKKGLINRYFGRG